MAVDAAYFAALAQGALVARGVRRGQLSLTFVDEDTIAELNRCHLAGDGPTDVLAFPLDAPFHADGGSGGVSDRPGPGSDVPVLLGDVLVCPAQAARNASERSVPVDDELALLVVHGVLHVLGMDHAEPDEAARMQAAERDLLARFHAPSSSWSAAHPEGAQVTRDVE